MVALLPVFLIITTGRLLSVVDSVSEEGEVPFAGIFGPYLLEGIRNLLSGNDILLPADGEAKGCGLVVDVDIQRQDQPLLV